jgi:hypothetical protein
MSDIKRMSIKEFRSLGFLQEANRLFFHPLGLALEVTIDDGTDEECLGGIWDYREDEVGMVFGPDMIKQEKIDYVNSLRQTKVQARIGCQTKEKIKINIEGLQII